VEELVKRDRKKSMTWLVAGLVLLQAGAAGVAHFVRQHAEESLLLEQGRVHELQREVERQRERQQPSPLAVVSTWELQPGPDVAANMQLLQQLGDRSGVVVEDLKVMPSNTRGRQTFLLTGRGRPGPTCAFLAAAEGNARLVVVENGRVMPGGDDEIYFELGIATWHQGGGR
jgi:hypothetical protein